MAFRKKEYIPGQEVGNNGVIFLEEVEPERKTAPSGRRHTYRVAKFLCPSCNEVYTARIENVERDKSTKCFVCGHKSGSKKILKDYKIGTSLGPNKDVIFLEEIPPMHFYDHSIRRGKFYNKKTKKIFETDIRLVVTGQSNGNSKSSGEILVEDILTRNNICFQTQKIFPDCKDESYLRFDFYLPAYNCCIEYDGIQHFEITGWNTKERFENLQKRDNIKNEYCQNKKIGLIRFCYKNKAKINDAYLFEVLNRVEGGNIIYA